MILLCGATGYTGRLVAADLDRRGVELVIAGRSREKLEALAGTLSSRVQLRVADVSEPAKLRAAVEGARVVLTCVGPFTFHGPPVQDAALDAGAHFLDITGEQGYMRTTFTRDEEARARGVALVNAVGFDVVPTDLAVHLAAQGLSRVRTVEVALSVAGFGVSRGTTQSAVVLMGGGGVCFHDGAWRDEPLATHRRSVPFPAPVGAREVISLPIGDIATAPRTTGARDVRAYVRLRKTVSRVLPLAHRAWQAVEGLGARRLADAWTSRLPEGPSPEERAATRFMIWARAEAEDGSAREVTSTGRDPYGLTAVIAAHAAQEIATTGPRAVGALTPSQALDPVALRRELEGVETTFVVHDASPSPP